MAVTTPWYQYPTNVTGLGSFVQWANEAVNNTMGNLLIGVTFLIAFITLSMVSKSSKAFPAASFITFIIAVLLSRIEGFIHPLIVVALLVATIIGTVWSATDKGY